MKKKGKRCLLQTMLRRRCSKLHFIKAIKEKKVLKLRNVDSLGKPALVFKTLKEIIEAEDARRQLSTSKDAECLDLTVSLARVKIEHDCPPLVERSLQEIEPQEKEFVRCGGGVDETGSDSDDNNHYKMTLKQLKEKLKTKKRKHANSAGSEQCSEVETKDNDSDLEEPLSSLKLKLTKAKRKCVQTASQSPELGTLPSVTQVETEVPEPVIKEYEHMIPSIDYSPQTDQSNELTVAKEMSNEAPNIVDFQNSKSRLCAGQYQSSRVNEESYDHLETVEPIALVFPDCEDIMYMDGQGESCQQFLHLPISECETEETEERPLLLTLPTMDYDSCMNNISRSFRQMNDIVDKTSCHNAVPGSNLMSDYHIRETEETEERPLLLTLPTMDDDSCMNIISRSFSQMHDFVEQTGCHHAVQGSNLVSDYCISGRDLYHGSDSILFTEDPKKDLASDQQMNATRSPSSTSWNHPPSLNSDDDLLSDINEQKQPILCSSLNGVKNSSANGNQLVLLEDKSTLHENEQNRSVTTSEEIRERNLPSENQNCDDDETLSTSELVQPPERLLLTRKVISPSSQERLSLAMNSAESYIIGNSKGNPCPSNQTKNKASSLESDVKHGNLAGNPKGSSVVNGAKESSSRMLKRSKSDRRNSPPKGNIEGPRLTRSLPSFSTGCTSLQVCSESAIAFSRRQMQDIESLAGKLMSELKYMKEIVEEKLLFEAYRNVSIRNDADEVKDAITNASKVEETSRKWLSMMARDCNRFCKIMSMTPKGTAPPTAGGEISRDKKKISFADEAGGTLCHVKVFGDETTLESNSEKQKTV